MLAPKDNRLLEQTAMNSTENSQSPTALAIEIAIRSQQLSNNESNDVNFYGHIDDIAVCPKF